MRRSLALSSWFRLPEHMERFEILSRGSCFRVGQRVALASAHVLAAWTGSHRRRGYSVDRPWGAGRVDVLTDAPRRSRDDCFSPLTLNVVATIF